MTTTIEAVTNLLERMRDMLYAANDRAAAANVDAADLRSDLMVLGKALPILEKYLTGDAAPSVQGHQWDNVDPLTGRAFSREEMAKYLEQRRLEHEQEIERQRQAVNAILTPYRNAISGQDWAVLNQQTRDAIRNDLERWQREGYSRGVFSGGFADLRDFVRNDNEPDKPSS